MRQYTRHPADVPIHISIDPNGQGVSLSLNIDGDIVDVSQGGIACEVATAIDVGSQVYVDISSVLPKYHGIGNVVWCKPKNNLFEVGVCFVDQEEAFRSRMVQQVCQIEMYKKMIYEREGRLLDGDEAAQEWVEKYAADFPQN
jgi:hypothetical protein